MARVITFSTRFPAYHLRAGIETFFVEKFWASMLLSSVQPAYQINTSDKALDHACKSLLNNQSLFTPKNHTIRMGNRWKVGDWFSPRIWSDKPYQSKQIKLGEDVQIKKIWTIELKSNQQFYIDDKIICSIDMFSVAGNDGLNLGDLLDWFKYPQPFVGQIICWNEGVNY